VVSKCRFGPGVLQRARSSSDFIRGLRLKQTSEELVCRRAPVLIASNPFSPRDVIRNRSSAAARNVSANAGPTTVVENLQQIPPMPKDAAKARVNGASNAPAIGTNTGRHIQAEWRAIATSNEPVTAGAVS